jgi:hypothetical protein
MNGELINRLTGLGDTASMTALMCSAVVIRGA